MLIHSLSLKNIRSYQEESLDFQEGITLLAGDIGSGKSTILLAIEFALFGIRRGDISGDGLLRHGEQEGSVTLTFHTDRTYVIHRTLKRSSQGVRQDGGYLEIDGAQELLTANELKARVLEILGYPEALLTKTKGFVFRYTVYTPQEELKQILFENDQSRLDTLRAVFGVDRYQLIQDNANLLAKKLRDDKRLLTEQLKDEEQLQEKARQLITEKEQASKEKIFLQQELAALKKQQEGVELTLAAQEELLEKERARKQRLLQITTQQDALKRQLASLSGKITAQQSLLAQEKAAVENPQQALDELQERLVSYKEKRAQAKAKEQQIKEQKRSLTAKSTDIADLSTCPVCQQDVGQDHKDHIAKDLAKEIAALDEKQSSVSTILAKLEKAITELSEKQLSLQQRKRMYDEHRLFTQKQTLAREQLDVFIAEEKSFSEQLKTLEKQQQAIAEPLADDTAFRTAKQELRTITEQVSNAKARVAGLVEREQQLSVRLLEAEQAIETTKQQKKQLSVLIAKERWLTQSFIPTVGVMEKHVLSAIHQEFSRLFTQWCQSLLDNEHIFATLSSSFAPVVTQSGYDMDVAHLSGGEKTSIALAYRLALNVVVNEFIQSLNTSDVLILDEPTDGFSSDQLDRVRDVLQELSVRQILVVSHEQKMQSYVNNVLVVHKREGVSSIA